MPLADDVAGFVQQLGAQVAALSLGVRVGQRNSGQQALSVDLAGVAQNLLARPLLYDFAAAHHRDTVSQGVNDCQVVGDEEAGEAHFFLELAEEFQHTGLNRNVEC